MKLLTAAFILISTYSFMVKAEPWIDTSNIFLRADLQLLSDKGHINSTLTTFPVMWAEVSRSLKNINESNLDESSKNAYWHIKQQLRRAKKNQYSTELNFSTDDKRFTSFGEEFRDANSAVSQFSFMGDSVALNIKASVIEDPVDGEEVRLDGSYFAAFMGNWVLSVGMYDRWWGPGWDSNLTLTNNARPLPAIAISRKSSEPFIVPFFNDIQIPWTVTTFMGQFEEERYVPNAWLWGFRFNAKLTANLEVGLSRLAQWEGDGRPGGFDTFMDVLAGKDLCRHDIPEDECATKEPGNQQFGYDIRYSPKWFGKPVSVYMQMLAEDGDTKGGLSFTGAETYSYGIDGQAKFFNQYWRVYLEYIDSFVDCTNPDRGNGVVGEGNCLYEHHIYRTGIRYEGKVLGNLYDNDSESVVIGAISQLNQLESWELKLRVVNINDDNSDLYPNNPNQGHSLTKVAEDLIMASIKYQLRQGKFKYTIGGSISHSTFENDDLKDKTEPNMYFNVHYTL